MNEQNGCHCLTMGPTECRNWLLTCISTLDVPSCSFGGEHQSSTARQRTIFLNYQLKLTFQSILLAFVVSLRRRYLLVALVCWEVIELPWAWHPIDRMDARLLRGRDAKVPSLAGSSSNLSLMHSSCWETSSTSPPLPCRGTSRALHARAAPGGQKSRR